MSGEGYLAQSFVGQTAPAGKRINPALFPAVPKLWLGDLAGIFEYVRPERHSELVRIVNNAADHPCNATTIQKAERIFGSVRLYVQRVRRTRAPGHDLTLVGTEDRMDNRCIMECCDAVEQFITEAREAADDPAFWSEKSHRVAAWAIREDYCAYCPELAPIVSGLSGSTLWKLMRVMADYERPAEWLTAAANVLNTCGRPHRAALARRAARDLGKRCAI